MLQVAITHGQPAVATSIGHVFKASQRASIVRDYIVDGGIALRGSGGSVHMFVQC